MRFNIIPSFFNNSIFERILSPSAVARWRIDSESAVAIALVSESTVNFWQQIIVWLTPNLTAKYFQNDYPKMELRYIFDYS
ncbi:MAG: hypothetical protein V7K68_03355 [Nostoc sp.]|uniref:hypothetical protein n=1 Tax=Nostoc sp. TaxID=1180 RepID=UPI002FFC4F8E